MAAYSDADLGPNLLIGTLRFRGKRIANKNKNKYDILSLSDTGKREMLKANLTNLIR